MDLPPSLCILFTLEAYSPKIPLILTSPLNAMLMCYLPSPALVISVSWPRARHLSGCVLHWALTTPVLRLWLDCANMVWPAQWHRQDLSSRFREIQPHPCAPRGRDTIRRIQLWQRAAAERPPSPPDPMSSPAPQQPKTLQPANATAPPRMFLQ